MSENESNSNRKQKRQVKRKAWKKRYQRREAKAGSVAAWGKAMRRDNKA